MNRGIGMVILICLMAATSYAQMGGGMMGNGMMGGPGWTGGNRGYMNQPQGAQGSELYGVLCSRCHGQGGNVIYPNLPLRGAPQLASFNAFLSFIRNPKMPDGSAGPMPPFPPDRISDAQAEALYNYLVQWLGSPQSRARMGPPTKDQTKQQVEDYLKSTGNPNLKLGKIEDVGKDFEVEIVTKDGSLVDKILVSKKTGRMRSIY